MAHKLLLRPPPVVLALANLALFNSGCQTACPYGPQCEDDHSAGGLAIHEGEALQGQHEIWDDATVHLDGDELLGTRWTATGIAGDLLIGMPDADMVIRQRYDITDSTVNTSASWSIEGTDFGTSIGVGFVDDDSEWDLFVGAPTWELQRGAAYLYLGAAHTQKSEPDLKITGASHTDLLGTNVAVCGDMTGDGRPELLVTAPWFLQPQTGPLASENIAPLAGAVFIITSEKLGEALAANTSVVEPWELGPALWGPEEGARLGHAIVCSHDLSGDGLADLAIGAPFVGDSGEDEDQGATYVVLGTSKLENGAIEDVASIIIPGRYRTDWAGMALAVIDVDGDELGDLAVGMPGFLNGRGRVTLYLGSDMAESPLNPKHLLTLTPPRGTEEAIHFGRWLTSGDLDGDLLPELVVGAPDFHSDRNYDEGRLWGFSATKREEWVEIRRADDHDTFRLEGSEPFQRVGRMVQIVDLDHDGRGELLAPIRTAP